MIEPPDENQQAFEDPLYVPVGPITKARSKKIKEAINGLIQEIWVDSNVGHSKLGPKEDEGFDRLANLIYLNLSNSGFSGQIPKEFSLLTRLSTLGLSSNNLEGPIPNSVFELRCLSFLDLSSNKFNGKIELSKFKKLGNLTDLSLSYNNLSINATLCNLSPSILPMFTTLRLASCRLTTLPDLSGQSSLTHLDLSQNQIHENIPSWIWKIGNGSLVYLNLSHNLLEDLHEPFSTFTPYLSILDLHSNQLHGQIPTPPIFCSYVDYSNNSFTSSIPEDIGTYIFFTIFFSLSKNNITGIIPASICNASYLRFLDFSDNALSGMIPSCLIGNEILEDLNLRRNKLSATIPGEFSGNCLLRTLDLNGNLLEGKFQTL
uniref:Uncharacterized protein n=1 Tax=Vitis vinifera TaxID=29760 RepID=F6GXV6_VITVI